MVIITAQRQQFIVCACFHYAAVLNDHNAIRVDYRGQAVRDNKRGPAL